MPLYSAIADAHEMTANTPAATNDIQNSEHSARMLIHTFSLKVISVFSRCILIIFLTPAS
jgi:hypothetical protein